MEPIEIDGVKYDVIECQSNTGPFYEVRIHDTGEMIGEIDEKSKGEWVPAAPVAGATEVLKKLIHKLGRRLGA